MKLRAALAPLAALAMLALQGCASAPKPDVRGLSDERPMTTLRDEAFARSERFVDAEAVLAARSAGVPEVRIAADAAGAGISPVQAELVANRAARDLCNGLARHLRIDEHAPDLRVDVVITAIRPTSSTAAGLSALLGVWVPGPFRLPAGLGGFAADGAARKGDEPVLLLHWAEGAGAITEDAKMSSIGDAYQLAGDFADDFVEAFAEPLGAEAQNRARVDDATRDANEAPCRARFGRASVTGRGASLLLPLSPESIDAGAPAASGARPAAAEAEERVGGAEADHRGE